LSDIDVLLLAVLDLFVLPFLSSLFLYRLVLGDSPAVFSENSCKKSKKASFETLIPTNMVGGGRTRKGFKSRQVAKMRLAQACKQMPEDWLA
jgi:hypothetical protein